MQLINTSDARMIGRLTREFMRVVHSDALSVRGKRNVMDGETELLTGFEFNRYASLTTVLLAPFTSSIDRVMGTLRIEMPDFVPSVMVRAPQGATHFRLISAAAEIDFEKEVHVVVSRNSPEIEINNSLVHLEPIIHNLTAGSTAPLFLVMGIEFCQEVNGTRYALKDTALNALSLVKINGGV